MGPMWNFSCFVEQHRHLATARIVLGGILSSLTAGTVHQPEDERCGSGGGILNSKKCIMSPVHIIYIYIFVYNIHTYIIYIRNYIYTCIYLYIFVCICIICIHLMRYIFYLDRSRVEPPMAENYCISVHIILHSGIFRWDVLQYVWGCIHVGISCNISMWGR